MKRRSRPKPRGLKRERTRSLLIDAAAKVIAAKGLDRTALEDIARRAGMTRGAIYGNFKNKEALFLAVAATRWQPILSTASPGATLRERMVTHGIAVAAAAPARRGEAVGATSFVQYALTHEHLRKLVEAANADIYQISATSLSDSVTPDQLPIPAEQFVRVVHALTEGLLILHALTPQLITSETMTLAFTLLARPTARREKTKPADS